MTKLVFLQQFTDQKKYFKGFRIKDDHHTKLYEDSIK